MSRNTSYHFSAKVTFIGIAIGASLSILFAAIGRPGLIGVGPAIGVSLVVAFSQREDR